MQRSFEAARAEKERRKHNWKKTVLRILLLLVLLLGGYGIVHKIMDYRTLGCNLMVLGEDVSWKTVEDAAELFQKKFQERQIVFQENGQELYRISFFWGRGLFSQRRKSPKKLTEIKEKNLPAGMASRTGSIILSLLIRQRTGRSCEQRLTSVTSAGMIPGRAQRMPTLPTMHPAASLKS